MAHTERTAPLTAVQWLLDIILEDTGGTIVRETFAKLDHSNQERSLGQTLWYMAKSLFFLLRGNLVAVLIEGNGVTVLAVGDRLDGSLLLYYRVVLMSRLKGTAGNIGRLVLAMGLV